MTNKNEKGAIVEAMEVLKNMSTFEKWSAEQGNEFGAGATEALDRLQREVIDAVPEELEFKPLAVLKNEDLLICDFDKYEKVFLGRSIPKEQYRNHREAAKILADATRGK